jgi:5-methyltetrahydrofolate--homocysteine methyltransferase
MNEILERMATALIAGKEEKVKSLAQDALNKDITAKEILDNSLLAGMNVVGKKFKAGDMFIPEVLLCARCMNGAMGLMQPMLSDCDAAG